MPNNKDKQNGPNLFTDELQQNAEAPFSTDEISEMRFSISAGAPPPPQQGGAGGGAARKPGPTPGALIALSALVFSVVALFLVLMGSTIVRFLNNGLQPVQNYTPPIDDGISLFENTGSDALTQSEALTPAQLAYLVSPSVTGVTGYEQGSAIPTFSGSGVVINAQGYIATICSDIHTYSSIGVTLQDGTVYLATLVGVDEISGLCVLKIDAENLIVPSFKTGDDTALGEQAVVVCNPGGAGTQVKQGIVNGKNTPASTFSDATLFNYIQTSEFTSAVGGAFVSPAGYITGLYAGNGWVYPISQAKPILDSLLKQDGALQKRALLGIYVRTLDPAAARATGMPDHGLYITDVTTYSPLPLAGIYPGAVIVSASGREMYSPQDLFEVLASHKPTDDITLEVFLPQTGETVKVTCPLANSGDLFIFSSALLEEKRVTQG